MKPFLKHACALCAGVIVFGAQADTLYVSGTVTDSAGVLISGAVVTARAGGFGGGRGGFTGGAGLRGVDTTDANGNYSIVIPNDTFQTVTVTATATGYHTSGRGQIDTIANPKDGKADHVTQNIILIEGTIGIVATGDTVVVSGTVTDSAGNPVDSATVTVTLRGGTAGAGGGFAGGAGSRAVTGTNGEYSITLRDDSLGLIMVTAATTARLTGSVLDTVKNPHDGVTDHVTVNIKVTTVIGVSGAPGDSVYVSGTVTDSTGAPVDSAIVSVRVGSGFGYSAGFHTVLTAANGSYSIGVIGDTSGIVTVTATRGGTTGSVTDTVASPHDGKTDYLTNVNIKLAQRSAVIMQVQPGAIMKRQNIAVGSWAIYTLDGRLVGTSRNGAVVYYGAARATGTQMLIYRNMAPNAGASVGIMQLK